MNRIENIHTVTKRLIVMTVIAVAALALIFGVNLYMHQRLMLTYLAFTCGIIGGFVSIQQRLKRVSDEELELLSRSWFQIVLVPIFGGVFALVLYCIFLSEIVTGHLFPKFTVPQTPQGGPTTQFMNAVLTQTYTASAQDLAKLLFWSFVAGFSERFVPQIITKVSSDAEHGRDGKQDEGKGG